MSLTQYVDTAGNVAITMAGVIYENHVVTFDTPLVTNCIINSGGSLTFTAANYATPQNLNITPKRAGSITLAYTVTSPYNQSPVRGEVVVTATNVNGVVIPTGGYVASIGFNPANFTGLQGWTVATITIPSGDPLIGKWLRMSSNFVAGYPNFMYCNITYPDGTTYVSGRADSVNYTQVTFTQAGTYKIKMARDIQMSGAGETGAYTFTATHQGGAVQTFTAARAYCNTATGILTYNPGSSFAISSIPAHAAPVGCTITHFADSFIYNPSYSVTAYSGTATYSGGGSASGTIAWSGTWAYFDPAASLSAQPAFTGAILTSLYDPTETTILSDSAAYTGGTPYIGPKAYP